MLAPMTVEQQSALQKAIELVKELKLKAELCGAWLWVERNPDTKTVKEQLKAAGFRWACKKEQWYFPGIPASGRGVPMDYIRSKYGSVELEKVK